MKIFRAYTQGSYSAEQFHILDTNNNFAEVIAETEAEAEELFRDYIHDTSLYNYDETEKWIEKNPIYVYEKR